MTEQEERPLVTFALFAYNQERFIREAVEGALAQTYSPLQVILSDDYSTDRTFEIMQEMVADYTGPHEILLNRNERNLGIGGHVNRVMDLSRGELIVGAAGDDISKPQRTTKTVDIWMSGQGIYSVHSRVEKIDENGLNCGYLENPYFDKFHDPVYVVHQMAWVTGSSHAWSKKVFERFKYLHSDVVNEDMVIPFRSLMLGSIEYIEEVLVKYRVGVGVSSSKIDSNELRIRYIPLVQSKRKLAVLRQYHADLSDFDCPSKSMLLSMIENKIFEEQVAIDFIEGRRGLSLIIIECIRRDLDWVRLFKLYLKCKLPKSIILANYKIKGV